MMMLLFERLEYDYDDVADQKVKELMMMLLIKRSECDDDVADQNIRV